MASFEGDRKPQEPQRPGHRCCTSAKWRGTAGLLVALRDENSASVEFWIGQGLRCEKRPRDL